jgi:hypothetical protein
LALAGFRRQHQFKQIVALLDLRLGPGFAGDLVDKGHAAA